MNGSHYCTVALCFHESLLSDSFVLQGANLRKKRKDNQTGGSRKKREAAQKMDAPKQMEHEVKWNILNGLIIPIVLNKT